MMVHLAVIDQLHMTLSLFDFQSKQSSPLDNLTLNKLPQLIRLVAAGEQFKKRIRSESKPKRFGVAPE